MPVLERAREERPPRPPRPRARDGTDRSRRRPDGRRSRASPPAGSARPSARSASRSRRRSARRRRGTTRAARVAVVRQSFVGVARVGGSALASRSRSASAALRSCKRERCRRRRPAGRCARGSTWPTTSSSTRRMCSEPTYVASAAAETLPPEALELRPPAHRVLELGAVRLDPERRTARPPTGAPSSTWLANTRSAGWSSRSASAFAATYASRSAGVKILQQPRLEALVAVEHERRQEPPRERRHDDAGTAEVVVAARSRSWQTIVTSCPARLHSRASARV